MSVTEAAIYIGISERTLRSLISKEVIVYKRILGNSDGRGRIIIRREDLDRYMQTDAA
ncbi:helix-turn-helix domain-containing protein [Pelagicoccus albus]